MKPLSKEAQVVFNKLFDGMTRVGDHKIVDAERGFMPVHLEIVGREKFGEHDVLIASIAHYCEHQGDLSPDPECTFLIGRVEPIACFPLSFYQGGMIYQEAARIIGGSIQFNAELQREIATFCNTWLENIHEQQEL
jgi:hypothetical protein